MVKQMQNNVLTQTGTVDTALLPEDEKRPNGLHSLEGVAYLLQKDASELDEIETLDGVGCFHKARDGAGFYLVDVRDMSCSCPGYRFRGHCRHIRHVEERVAEEAFPKMPATSKPRKMTEDQLAQRKARIDARNAKLAEQRAARTPTKTTRGFNAPPDEALA